MLVRDGVAVPHPTDEITTREALKILGLKEHSTITRYVHAGKLTPSRKLPWTTGPYLFWRTDIERLAAERKAS